MEARPLGLAEEAARRIAFAGAPQAVERAKALLGLHDRSRERRLVYRSAEMMDAAFA